MRPVARSSQQEGLETPNKISLEVIHSPLKEVVASLEAEGCTIVFPTWYGLSAFVFEGQKDAPPALRPFFRFPRGASLVLVWDWDQEHRTVALIELPIRKEGIRIKSYPVRLPWAGMGSCPSPVNSICLVRNAPSQVCASPVDRCAQVQQ